VVNPSTGEVIAEAPLSSQEDVDPAISAVRKAFAQWSRTTPGESARALLAIADAIDDHAEELAAIESAGAGKPLRRSSRRSCHSATSGPPPEERRPAR
jgi:betaine-aldehyde dehydrogenase